MVYCLKNHTKNNDTLIRSVSMEGKSRKNNTVLNAELIISAIEEVKAKFHDKFQGIVCDAITEIGHDFQHQLTSLKSKISDLVSENSTLKNTVDSLRNFVAEQESFRSVNSKTTLVNDGGFPFEGPLPSASSETLQLLL